MPGGTQELKWYIAQKGSDKRGCEKKQLEEGPNFKSITLQQSVWEYVFWHWLFPETARLSLRGHTTVSAKLFLLFVCFVPRQRWCGIYIGNKSLWNICLTKSLGKSLRFNVQCATYRFSRFRLHYLYQNYFHCPFLAFQKAHIFRSHSFRQNPGPHLYTHTAAFSLSHFISLSYIFKKAPLCCTALHTHTNERPSFLLFYHFFLLFIYLTFLFLYSFKRLLMAQRYLKDTLRTFRYCRYASFALLNHFSGRFCCWFCSLALLFFIPASMCAFSGQSVCDCVHLALTKSSNLNAPAQCSY